MFGDKILTGGGFFSGNNNANFLMGLGAHGNSLSPYGGVSNPDIWHSGAIGTHYDAGMHFDNMKFPQIMGNLAKIQSLLHSNVTAFNEGDKSAYDLGHDVGVAAHAIQDLYSHSNYVELYAKAYPTQHDSYKIPTIEEALHDPKYAKFKALIATELKTGEYPSEGGADSHKDMNHDKGAGTIFNGMQEVKGKTVDWYSKAAERVATKATKKLLADVKNKVKNK